MYIGSPLSKEKLLNVCNLNFSKEPIEVSKNIIYLCEIPITNDFETRYNIDNITNDVLVIHAFHILRLKLHWDKLLTNKNIRSFYDFFDSNLLSYQNIINNNDLYNLMLKQFSKTKEFIESSIIQILK